MTNFNSLKARIIGTWTGNESETTENPKATNIWLKFNALVQHFTDNFDSLVRSLFSVSGDGSYDSATGQITINSFPTAVSNVSTSSSGELLIDFTDASQANLGAVGSGLVQSVQVVGAGTFRVTYANGYIVDFNPSAVNHANLLFLPFEGTNGDTTTTNLGTGSYTIVFSSFATISDEQSNEGLTSAKFPTVDDNATIEVQGSAGWDLSRQWEFEITFYPTSAGTIAGAPSVVATSYDSSFFNGIDFILGGDGWGFRILDGTSTRIVEHIMPEATFPADTWSNFKVRKYQTTPLDPVRVAMFVNDVSVYDQIHPEAFPITGENLTIGNNVFQNVAFKGYIDLVNFKYLD